jgi:chromosome segregation ATPase
MVSPEEVKAGVQKTKETLRKEMYNTNTVLKEGIEKNNETLTTLAENVNENADTISTVKNKFLEKNNEANTELDRLTKKFKEASQTTSALETQSKNLLTDMLRIQTLIHQNNSAIENHIKAERELETQSEEQTHILKVLKGKINEADKRIEKVEKRNDRLLDLLDMATFIIERLKKHATNKNSKLSNTIVTFQEGCQRYNLTVSLNNGLSDMPRNNNALTMFPYRLATSSENMLEYSTGYTKVTDL